MGKTDTVTKDYLKDTKVFADAFNLFIYGGEQVIDAAKLHEMDSTAVALPPGAEGKSIPVQKYRDMLKSLTAMTDGAAAYLILGIESQTHVHYAMPVRADLYDALEYANQVEEAAGKRREERKTQKKKHSAKDNIQRPTADEYLSGFYKEDKLIPVITLVIYFSPEEWDGPLSLHEMFSVKDPRILSLVPDYRINFLSPAAMSEEEINRLQTSLREVMLYIKNSKDKKKLAAIVNENASFKALDRKAAEVIRAVTNTTLVPSDGKEDNHMNMCKALEDMCSDAREEAREETRLEDIRNLMKTLELSVEKAMIALGIPEKDFPKYLSRLQKQ